MKAIKAYVIFRPDGTTYTPNRRGNRIFMVKSAAISRCPKFPGYRVVEFLLSGDGDGTCVFVQGEAK